MRTWALTHRRLLRSFVAFFTWHCWTLEPCHMASSNRASRAACAAVLYERSRLRYSYMKLEKEGGSWKK